MTIGFGSSWPATPDWPSPDTTENETASVVGCVASLVHPAITSAASTILRIKPPSGPWRDAHHEEPCFPEQPKTAPNDTGLIPRNIRDMFGHASHSPGRCRRVLCRRRARRRSRRRREGGPPHRRRLARKPRRRLLRLLRDSQVRRSLGHADRARAAALSRRDVCPRPLQRVHPPERRNPGGVAALHAGGRRREQ